MCDGDKEEIRQSAEFFLLHRGAAVLPVYYATVQALSKIISSHPRICQVQLPLGWLKGL
jgi:hypothetical protein